MEKPEKFAEEDGGNNKKGEKPKKRDRRKPEISEAMDKKEEKKREEKDKGLNDAKNELAILEKWLEKSEHKPEKERENDENQYRNKNVNVGKKTIGDKKRKWRSKNKNEEWRTERSALLAPERKITPKRGGNIDKESSPMKTGKRK